MKQGFVVICRFICRFFGLALLNILLATPSLASFAAEERDLPGRWAFRARGSAFEAGFGDDFTQVESGLRFKDVKDGDGKEIIDGMGVKINFVGYILSDGKKFDSTWDKGRYVSFKARARFLTRANPPRFLAYSRLSSCPRPCSP